MNRTFTCLLCPNGCEIIVDYKDRQILEITGALCSKGNAYVKQELLDPQRNIASSVLVSHGHLPLVSVRLSRAVPKDLIFPIMAEIRKQRIEAPVALGQVLIRNVLGLDCDVVATKHVIKITNSDQQKIGGSDVK